MYRVGKSSWIDGVYKPRPRQDGTGMSRLSVKCISILLVAAVCLIDVPLSFAEFTTDGFPVTITASVTIVTLLLDTDTDGMPDGWEDSFGLNSDNPNDAFWDGDNDGINNLEEYRMGTDPTVSESGIVATLTATPSSGLMPLDVTFTALASGGSYPIVRYEWDFDGNGTYDRWSYASEGNQVRYRYTSAGAHIEEGTGRRFHIAKLRAIDSMGQAGIASRIVYVDRDESLSPPVVEPDLNFASVSIPGTVELDATAFNTNRIVRYEWDTTGDGEFDILLTKSADITRTYNDTGGRAFNATVKVTDINGLSDMATVGIQTDAERWNSSLLPYKPKVYLDNHIVYGTAGAPVSIGGYGAPELGYAKKLEWDFENDGTYDWSSTIESPDWRGSADLEHTYGAPGIYRATLRVNTEATVSATDSVLVIISENGTPPNAVAKVSYNGTSDADEIDGMVPIKAKFDHSSSSGAGGLTYEWDFDGDKLIDYSTDSSSHIPTYDYRFPGYYIATLKVTDANGLVDTAYIPVMATYPAGDGEYSSNVRTPFEGAKIAGNAVTLVCDVFPDDAGVNEVMFQYRRKSAGGALLTLMGEAAPEDDSTPATWNNIDVGAQVSSYVATWDTTGLEDGVVYELRAIVNGEDSDSFKVTSVEVDNLIPDFDIKENKNTISHEKEAKVFSRRRNALILPDGAYLSIAPAAVGTDAGLAIDQLLGARVDSVKLDITGIESFSKDIKIIMPYLDEDNNGIVDGTDIDEDTLIVRWFNEETLQWETAYDSVVYPDENFVSAKTNHLSLWGLFSSGGGGVTDLISGAGSAAGSSVGVSYCFIATAAYGTPMAEDVVALRKLRDRYLMRKSWGRKFIWYYYRYSPTIAQFIKDKPTLRAVVRFLLKPIVKFAKELK